jgi:hypothetical protein
MLLRGLNRLQGVYSGGGIAKTAGARAVTLDRDIFVDRSQSLSIRLFVHELVHVAQFGIRGVGGFVKNYYLKYVNMLYSYMSYGFTGAAAAKHTSRYHPYERPAYDIDAHFNDWATRRNLPRLRNLRPPP